MMMIMMMMMIYAAHTNHSCEELAKSWNVGANMWASLWREAKREVQTTVGRRRARYAPSSAETAPPLPPIGRQGIVVEESDEPDGWDVRVPRTGLAAIIRQCCGSAEPH